MSDDFVFSHIEHATLVRLFIGRVFCFKTRQSALVLADMQAFTKRRQQENEEAALHIDQLTVALTRFCCTYIYVLSNTTSFQSTQLINFHKHHSYILNLYCSRKYHVACEFNKL